MADTYKVLGQQAPGAATSTTLYTCPAATQTIVAAVTICNRSSVPTSWRLGVDVNGAGDSNEDYIGYDVPIGANEVVVLKLGLTLDASDLLRCYATLATLTFGAFGVEKT